MEIPGKALLVFSGSSAPRRLSSLFTTVAVVACLVTGTISPLWSQSTRGTITGVVRDTSGAVIPGVSVTITEEETGNSLSVKSQEDGVYTAPQILPGTYRVSAQTQGFKRLVVSGLKVNVDTTLTQDMILEIGVTRESVEVAWQTSLVAFPVYLVIRRYDHALLAFAVILVTSVILKFTWYDHLKTIEIESAEPRPVPPPLVPAEQLMRST